MSQRVADRKAGRDVEPDSRSKKWAKTLSTLGYAISLVGLGLLAYEAMIIAQGTEPSIVALAIYAGMFIGGRLIKLTLDTARPFM